VFLPRDFLFASESFWGRVPKRDVHAALGLALGYAAPANSAQILAQVSIFCFEVFLGQGTKERRAHEFGHAARTWLASLSFYRGIMLTCTGAREERPVSSSSPSFLLQSLIGAGAHTQLHVLCAPCSLRSVLIVALCLAHVYARLANSTLLLPQVFFSSKYFWGGEPKTDAHVHLSMLRAPGSLRSVLIMALDLAHVYAAPANSALFLPQVSLICFEVFWERGTKERRTHAFVHASRT